MPKHSGLLRWLWIADGTLLSLAILGAFYLRFGGDPPLVNFRTVLWILPITFVGGPLVLANLGLYRSQRQRLIHVIRAVTSSVWLQSLLIATVSFWARQFSYPRTVLILGMLAQWLVLGLWRWFCWRGLGFQRGARQLLLVADSAEETVQIRTKVLAEWQAFQLVRQGTSSACLEEPDAWLGGVEGVVIAPNVPPTVRMLIVSLAQDRGLSVNVVPDLYDVTLIGAAVDRVDDLLLFDIQPLGQSPFDQQVKRGMDLAVGSLLFLISLPVMAFVGLAIRLTSSGPVLYRQTRLGRGGKPFELMKFRTMFADAEARTGPVLATADDPRVTPLGRFLRSSRLDELPQLWNVLRGEMSIVGPRPERPFFVKQFTEEVPSYHYRMLVPPGITGMAQVRGRYATKASDKLRYDLLYIRTWSPLLDILILLETVPVVFLRRSGSAVDAAQQSSAQLHG